VLQRIPLTVTDFASQYLDVKLVRREPSPLLLS
jgi:hypothetical protein